MRRARGRASALAGASASTSSGEPCALGRRPELARHLAGDRRPGPPRSRSISIDLGVQRERSSRSTVSFCRRSTCSRIVREELGARVRVELLVLEQLDEAAEGEDRRAQLVRGVGDELLAARCRAREASLHLVEGARELAELVARSRPGSASRSCPPATCSAAASRRLRRCASARAASQPPPARATSAIAPRSGSGAGSAPTLSSHVGERRREDHDPADACPSTRDRHRDLPSSLPVDARSVAGGLPVDAAARRPTGKLGLDRRALELGVGDHDVERVRRAGAGRARSVDAASRALGRVALSQPSICGCERRDVDRAVEARRSPRGRRRSSRCELLRGQVRLELRDDVEVDEAIAAAVIRKNRNASLLRTRARSDRAPPGLIVRRGSGSRRRAP